MCIDITQKSLRILDLIRKISLNYTEYYLTSTIQISARAMPDDRKMTLGIHNIYIYICIYIYIYI